MRMRGLLLLASPLLAQLDIPGHRDLLLSSQMEQLVTKSHQEQIKMKPEQNQSSEVTQAEISSLYSDNRKTFTVYPAVVETVIGDKPHATPQPFLPTSSFFPNNEQDVLGEDEEHDVEVLERKSEAEPEYVLQGRSLGGDLVYPMKHQQDLDLQRKQQALNIQKQQQQQQALELMQQQRALQQQYMMLQQQQALSLQQQQALPQTIQLDPYSSLQQQQQQPSLQQPYLQQLYPKPQQSYTDITGQPLYQALPSPQALNNLQQQPYNLPSVVQPAYPSPVAYIPADEPQPSASALGGQFQPYQPTYQDQYDDIGNEQVLPLPYGELAPRADQPEEGLYPQESYTQPQEANERGYGIGGLHHGGYGGHHPVVAPVVGHGLHRVHTHQRIPFPVPVPHPVPVPVVRAIHHQHHTAGGDGQHASSHEHGHNHNHDHQHGHQHSHENSHNHVHKHTHHHDHHHNHKHHNEHVHEEKHKHGHEHAHAHKPVY